MDDFWKKYWVDHAHSTESESLQLQIQRQVNKEPVSDLVFQQVLEDIERKTALNNDDVILDLCCGNGVITTYLAQHCKQMIGVDFAENLTRRIDLTKYPNISLIIEDIRKVQFEPEIFNKVIIYAGIQYLTHRETIQLFQKVLLWMKRDGLFFLGDIPDENHLWDFSNSRERRARYYGSVRDGTPLIGTWFTPQWLKNLGEFAGFREAEVLSQPLPLPYSHYRFDILLRK